jgi:transcription termination factor NusG
MSDWCILRCSGRHTLPLAESLTKGGFEAWSPYEEVEVVKGGRKVRAPIWPTWIFAKGIMMDFINLANDPTKQHPDFSVFRFNGVYRTVPDDDLQYIRRYVTRRRKPRQRVSLPRGAEVMADDDAWRGIPGVVERDNGKLALILFGWMKVELRSELLYPRMQAA